MKEKRIRKTKGKKQLKAAEKRKKVAGKMKKKVLSTLDWCDIREVKNSEILLESKDRKIFHVSGVKVKPHDIFLDDDLTMKGVIERWRLALDKMSFRIFWCFVTSPVDIGDYKAELYEDRENAEDASIKKMIADDYEKAEHFEKSHKELEFMHSQNEHLL